MTAGSSLPVMQHNEIFGVLIPLLLPRQNQSPYQVRDALGAFVLVSQLSLALLAESEAAHGLSEKF
jgi:hypothetical protein